jgi:hypothetical protein
MRHPCHVPAKRPVKPSGGRIPQTQCMRARACARVEGAQQGEQRVRVRRSPVEQVECKHEFTRHSARAWARCGTGFTQNIINFPHPFQCLGPVAALPAGTPPKSFNFVRPPLLLTPPRNGCQKGAQCSLGCLMLAHRAVTGLRQYGVQPGSRFHTQALLRPGPQQQCGYALSGNS